jgi:hypothetical protein
MANALRGGRGVVPVGMLWADQVPAPDDRYAAADLRLRNGDVQDK